MGVSVRWDSPETNLLLVELRDAWDWIEYWRCLEEARALVQHQGGSKPYRLIVHLTEDATRPGAAAYRQWKQTFQRMPIQLDTLVIVSPCDLLRSFADAAAEKDPSLRHRLHTAQSLPEARALLTALPS